MKKWLLAVLFGAVLVLGACGGDDTEEPADTDDTATEETETDEASEGGETVNTAAGEDVYQTNCAGCHGADLSGGMGPELTTIGSKYSEEELSDIITEGIGTMPAQKVEGEDLNALTAWLVEQQ